MIKGEDHASRRYGSRCGRKWLDEHFEGLLFRTGVFGKRHLAVNQVIMQTD